MNWFGQPWDAPVCEEGQQVPTPVGAPCMYCEKPILPEHRGILLMQYTKAEGPLWPEHLRGQTFPAYIAVHINCMVRATVGPKWPGDTVTMVEDGG